MGYINDSHFPNFQTVEILKVADIVSLSLKEDSSDEVDRVSYHLTKDDMNAIRKRLPRGFTPSFFGICKRHTVMFTHADCLLAPHSLP